MDVRADSGNFIPPVLDYGVDQGAHFDFAIGVRRETQNPGVNTTQELG